jgi:hypothetical protein
MEKNGPDIFSLLQISPFSHHLSLRLLFSAICNGRPYQKYTRNSGMYNYAETIA